MISDKITLKQISKLRFITAPPLKIREGEIERVFDIAARNGIGWRKCYEILHNLDRDPNFELRWYQMCDGDVRVRIRLSEENRSCLN